MRVKLIRLLVLGTLLLFPVTRDLYLIQELTQFIIYGIFGISLSLLWGYAGILCFGHAAFLKSRICARPAGSRSPITSR